MVLIYRSDHDDALFSPSTQNMPMKLRREIVVAALADLKISKKIRVLLRKYSCSEPVEIPEESFLTRKTTSLCSNIVKPSMVGRKPFTSPYIEYILSVSRKA